MTKSDKKRTQPFALPSVKQHHVVVEPLQKVENAYVLDTYIYDQKTIRSAFAAAVSAACSRLLRRGAYKRCAAAHALLIQHMKLCRYDVFAHVERGEAPKLYFKIKATARANAQQRARKRRGRPISLTCIDGTVIALPQNPQTNAFILPLKEREHLSFPSTTEDLQQSDTGRALLRHLRASADTNQRRNQKFYHSSVGL